MLAVDATHGQQPEARVVAHPDQPRVGVTEPAIAAGLDTVVTVFYDGPDSSHKVGRYGAYNIHTDRWARGEIDPNTPYHSIMDLSIAYEPTSRGFMAAAKTPTKILTCRFYAGPQLGEVTPAGWEVAWDQGSPLDKPWIVAGELMPAGQEYYIVYWTGWNAPYAYLRSTNAGESWCQDLIRLADTGEPVVGTFCAQPAVYADRPLYVAYVTRPVNAEIRFLRGEDVDPTGGVRFWELLAPPPDPNNPEAAPVSVPLNDRNIFFYLPGPFGPPTATTVPQLAVDPTDPDRLYIVYHDIAAPGSTDVNVYLHELTRDREHWQLGPRVEVNNDETLYESDQFLPSVSVDDAGRIHIIFYDDRNYTDGPQGDLQPDEYPEPKFDAYYAWSDDQGLNWTNSELHAVPPEPALDWTVEEFDFREYIGITWYRYGDVTKVWTAYTGTWGKDPQPNDTVISSSLVPWSAP